MQKLFMKCALEEELVLISDKLSSDTMNVNTQEQSAEDIIENTEKSFFDLAEEVFHNLFLNLIRR